MKLGSFSSQSLASSTVRPKPISLSRYRFGKTEGNRRTESQKKRRTEVDSLHRHGQARIEE